METRTVLKRNVKVVESVLDELRKDGCLCWNCQRLVTVEEDTGPLMADYDDVITEMEQDEYEAWANKRADELARAYNCPVAQRIYDACVAGEGAAPVTRCPLYLPGRYD